MIVRRVRFGDGPSVPAAPTGDVDVTVSEQTAVKGLMFWVLGGVLTHIAIRWVDSAFYKEK